MVEKPSNCGGPSYNLEFDLAPLCAALNASLRVQSKKVFSEVQTVWDAKSTRPSVSGPRNM